MHTILVCDAEPITIEGLLRLLESAEGMRVVAAQNCFPDGMDAIHHLQPSMVVLDKSLGLHSVLEWLIDLRRASSAMPVMVWGSPLSDSEALRLINAGASGVVRKTAPLESILSCIYAVLHGRTWMEENVSLVCERPLQPGRSPLTAREMQVLDLVKRGLKNKDIAESLGIRLGTVKIHVKHIFEKTGVRGRYGLALSGMRQKGTYAAAGGIWMGNLGDRGGGVITSTAE